MMQTAVRQAMPYALDRKQLSQNFNVRRETSVTPKTPTGPQKTLGIASSAFASQDIKYSRSQSHVGYASPTLPSSSEERPKSDSAMSVLDRPYLKDIDTSEFRREKVYLETDRDRQSMKDLVEFLRSSHPPPQNHMSCSDTNCEKPMEKAPRRPFRLFRKNGSRKNPPRDIKTNLMQLPDSAVASTTIEGHRHIAISIPVQYHPHEPTPKRYDRKAQETLMNPLLPTRNSRGTVTVLRPVLEDKEFPASQREAEVFNHDTHIEDFKQSKEIPHVLPTVETDPNDDLIIFFRQERRREAACDHKDQGRLFKNYTMPPVSNINRMDSIRSDVDPRHSGGTMYSERTLPATETTHSRDVSSGSLSPTSNQTTTLGPMTNLPTRRSSLTQNSVANTASAISTALATAKTSMETADGCTYSTSVTETTTPTTEAPLILGIEKPTKARSIAESTFSDTSEAVVVSAEVAQAYPGAAAISAEYFKTSGPAGPAPNRKLPDLPQGSDDSKSIRTLKSVKRLNNERKPSILPEDVEKANLRAVQKTRKEAVEARIRRDVALDKARRSTQAVLEAMKPLQTTPQQSKRAPTIHVSRIPSSAGSYRGHHRRRSSNVPIKQKDIRRRNSNTLSPILLVAEFEPQTGYHISNEYNFPSPPRRQIAQQNHSRCSSGQEIQTPPRSASPSLPSSDDECTTYVPTHKRSASAGTEQRIYTPQHKRGLSSTATNGIRLRELHSAPQIDKNKEWRFAPSHRRVYSSTSTNGLRSRELSATAFLDERRELRRSKHDSVVYEAELDDRIKKMERNVAQLVDMNRSVLEIGKQLGSISQILNKEGPGRGKGVLTKAQPVPSAGRGHGRDLGIVEPLMREILGGVRKI